MDESYRYKKYASLNFGNPFCQVQGYLLVIQVTDCRLDSSTFTCKLSPTFRSSRLIMEYSFHFYDRQFP